MTASRRNAKHAVDRAAQVVPEADTASEARLQALEDLSVNGVYNAIAPHFSATRCCLLPDVHTTFQSCMSTCEAAFM